ncbi:MAG: hypothetical protein NVSMB57_07410 [Actinomycetota bacterium]
MTSYAERRAGPGQDALSRIVSGIAAGTVDSAGRQLSAFGVRYVFVRDADADLVNAFMRQSDLRFGQRFAGSAVFSNDTWIPLGASINAGGWALASRFGDESASAVAGAEPNPQHGAGFRQRSPDVLSGTVRQSAKRVVLGTTFDPRWRLSFAGTKNVLRSQRSFGWANGFAVSTAGKAILFWDGQGGYHLLLLVQVAMLFALAFAISRRVAADRGER